MRAILSGRLSEQDIRRIRAYRISPDAMEKLVEHDIVPAGYPDPNVLFSDGAYRLDGPADMQLPMSTLQRDLVEQHLAVHEDWPERATHYSRVDWDEFQVRCVVQRMRMQDAVQDAVWMQRVRMQNAVQCAVRRVGAMPRVQRAMRVHPYSQSPSAPGLARRTAAHRRRRPSMEEHPGCP